MALSMMDILREREEIEVRVRGLTLGHLLHRNATAHGAAPAVTWRFRRGLWRTLSWSHLRQGVLDVAAGLASLGLGRGDTVVIMASNRPEHVMAHLGAAHALAMPSTFYSTLAPPQILSLAKDCHARVAILEDPSFLRRWQDIRGSLPELEGIILMEGGSLDGALGWEEFLSQGRGADVSQRWREARAEEAAALVYTSSTTGPPKGVPLSHHNILFEVESLDRLLRLPLGFTGVSYMPLAHMAQILVSIYLPLWKAGHAYLCPEAAQASDYLRKARPYAFFGVPRVWEKIQEGLLAQVRASNPVTRKVILALLHMSREAVLLHQQNRRELPGLRIGRGLVERALHGLLEDLGLDRCAIAASSAAGLSVDVAEFFAALGLPIMEAYGMTETTGLATANPPDRIRIGSVGTSLPGVEVILGEGGEILVRGPNTVSGYLGLPEASADLKDDQGWLRTGDIGRMDEEGYFWVVDRKKELIVTSGGKKVSPTNIEDLLKDHPLIGQALVYGDDRPYLVALITLDGQAVADWASQRGLSDQDLPSLSRHPDVRAEVDRAVGGANAQLARAEQIRRFCIVPVEWTIRTGELTPTGKLKRRVIYGKHEGEIEGLYQGK